MWSVIARCLLAHYTQDNIFGYVDIDNDIVHYSIELWFPTRLRAWDINNNTIRILQMFCNFFYHNSAPPTRYCLIFPNMQTYGKQCSKPF